MGNTPCRDHTERSSGLVLGTFRKPVAAASASLNPVTVDRPGRGQPTRPPAAVRFDQYGGQFRVTAARVSLQTSCNSVVSEREVGPHAS